MAAAGHPGEDARLFDAVRAVGMELCPEIDLSIPVGKDSLSMQAQWVGAGIGESRFGIREGEDQGSAVPNPQSPIPNPGVTHKSRSEEHTSELQSLMRISYAVFCLKKNKNINTTLNKQP